METAHADERYATFTPWPRRQMKPPPPQPPQVTASLVRLIREQDVRRDQDEPLPPAASKFVNDLSAWHKQLLHYFGMSNSCYAGNTRAAAARIRDRIKFLDKERVTRIMKVVETGYKIPFTSRPKPFHRNHNSPDLLQYKNEAWEALTKDMSHGAVVPCNLQADGMPTVVSPVRTAPK